VTGSELVVSNSRMVYLSSENMIAVGTAVSSLGAEPLHCPPRRSTGGSDCLTRELVHTCIRPDCGSSWVAMGLYHAYRLVCAHPR
jgi:hypothetical protein